MATVSKSRQVAARWLLGVHIECVIGDIAAQPGLHAIVCSASADLRGRGHVAGAIHRRAGPALALDCARHAPLSPGVPVITPAHQLPNKYVIHARGPKFGDPHAEAALAACYRRALQLAHQHGVVSLGVPAISTGNGGFPMYDAATIALEAMLTILPECRNVRRIRVVLRDTVGMAAYARALDEAAQRLIPSQGT